MALARQEIFTRGNCFEHIHCRFIVAERNPLQLDLARDRGSDNKSIEPLGNT